MPSAIMYLWSRPLPFLEPNMSFSYMAYFPQHQVQQFLDARMQMEAAAIRLFWDYTAALPDEQNWKGQYAWDCTHGTVEFSDQYIEFSKERFSHGETQSFYLTLPLRALYEPEFVAAAAREAQEVKIRQEEDRQRHTLAVQADYEKQERLEYERLKVKYGQ